MGTRARLHWLIALLAVVALVGAACGGDDGTDNGTVSTTEPTTEPADGGAETVALEDFRFNPADLTVATGTTLTLDNTGQAPHTFTVEGQDIDEEVAAGESGEVTIDLEAGSYDVVCRFHEGQGMVGTLTVE